jgi:hypothetical protein
LIYEMRIYEILPGRMPAIHKRFAEHTMKIFKRLNMRVVGFWSTEVGNSNELVYLMEFDDMESRLKLWDTFRADPEWQKASAESEKDGPIVARVRNSLLRPTPYSPMK